MTPYSDAERVTCRIRSRYPTKAQAKRGLKEARNQPNRRHYVTYRCGFCGEFHNGPRPVTTTTPQRKDPAAPWQAKP